MDTPKTIFVRRYRTIRYLFWFCLFLSVVGALAGTPLALLFALPALVLAFASIFQHCPQCQEHVGFKRFGPFLAGVPVVRHCIHCGTNLASNSSFKGDALKRAP